MTGNPCIDCRNFDGVDGCLYWLSDIPSIVVINQSRAELDLQTKFEVTEHTNSKGFCTGYEK